MLFSLSIASKDHSVGSNFKHEYIDTLIQFLKMFFRNYLIERTCYFQDLISLVRGLAIALEFFMCCSSTFISFLLDYWILQTSRSVGMGANRGLLEMRINMVVLKFLSVVRLVLGYIFCIVLNNHRSAGFNLFCITIACLLQIFAIKTFVVIICQLWIINF